LEEEIRQEDIIGLRVLYDLTAIVIVALTYPITTTVLPVFTGFIGVVARLSYWGMIIVFSVNAIRYNTSPQGSGYVSYAVASAATLFTSYVVLGGFMSGLGRSPYQFTASVLVFDILQTAISVLGIELLRYYIIARMAQGGYPGLGLVVAALATASYRLTPLKLATMSLSAPLETMSALSYFVSEFALGLFSGLLMLSTNTPIMGLAFTATYRLLYRLTPFLPDLLWYENLFLTLVLVLVLYSVTVYALSPPGAGKGTSVTYMFPVLAIALAVWLSQGVLGVYLFAITSTSMTPSLNVGDLVIVVKAEPSTIRVGDVVVYKNTEGTMVAHRVVDIVVGGKKTYFITKGDAVASPDPDPVPPGAIAGKVVYKLPKLGWVSIMFRRAVAYVAQAYK
jgi:signal peptidase